MDDIFRVLMERRGTNAHLAVGIPPIVRIDGHLRPMQYEKLTAEDCQRLLHDILSDEQMETLRRARVLVYSYEVPRLTRSRFTVFHERGRLAAIIWFIPRQIPTAHELELPPALVGLTDRDGGLLLVSGPGGAGKSTTLAALVNHINSTRSKHILTVEQPIEFLQPHKYSMIRQCEVGTEFDSHAAALCQAAHLDVDVVMSDGVPDLAAFGLLLELADAGLLVVATVRSVSRSAAVSLQDWLASFPEAQQRVVRVRLARVLLGVCVQQLLRRANQPGRTLATELLVASDGLRQLVRGGRLGDRGAVGGAAGPGSHSLERDLLRLYAQGAISYVDAVSHAPDAEEMRKLVGGGST